MEVQRSEKVQQCYRTRRGTMNRLRVSWISPDWGQVLKRKMAGRCPQRKTGDEESTLRCTSIRDVSTGSTNVLFAASRLHLPHQCSHAIHDIITSLDSIISSTLIVIVPLAVLLFLPRSRVVIVPPLQTHAVSISTANSIPPQQPHNSC